MTAMFATSLPGFIPSGTVLQRPHTLRAASASMLGLCARESGVIPLSSG